MEFSTGSRKESLWRNKRPRNRWLPSVPVLWHLPGAHLEITNAVHCCRQTGHCRKSGLDALLSASLFVSVPFLVLVWLCGFLFSFLCFDFRDKSLTVAQTCLKIAAEPLCQPQSTGVTGVGYCIWLPPLSPTVWMFLAGCHRHTTLDEFKIQPQTCLQKA